MPSQPTSELTERGHELAGEGLELVVGQRDEVNLVSDISQDLVRASAGKSHVPSLSAKRYLTPLMRPQKFPDTLGSLEGNTEGPGTASSEPLLPS